MSESGNTGSLAQQALLVAGVLGGISFTALVLVVQAQDEFLPKDWGSWGQVYFGGLGSLIAVVTILFVWASFGMMGQLRIVRELKKGPKGSFNLTRNSGVMLYSIFIVGTYKK